MTDTPLWTPSHPETTNLAAFIKGLGHVGDDYQAFWRWSVENPEKFWDAIWDYTGVIGDKGERLKRIGTEARQELEKLMDCKVFLEIWVKVRSGWADDDARVRSFGYE